MSYQDDLKVCLASGQMSASEFETHVQAGEMTGLIPAARLPDAHLDTAIYAIDAVMNDAQPGDEIPPFMLERMEQMRAILRKLIAAAGGVQ